MATDSTELTFVRCPSCRSLVPAVSTKCRMCGAGLEVAAAEGSETGEGATEAPAQPVAAASTNGGQSGKVTESGAPSGSDARGNKDIDVSDPLGAYLDSLPAEGEEDIDDLEDFDDDLEDFDDIDSELDEMDDFDDNFDDIADDDLIEAASEPLPAQKAAPAPEKAPQPEPKAFEPPAQTTKPKQEAPKAEERPRVVVEQGKGRSGGNRAFSFSKGKDKAEAGPVEPQEAPRAKQAPQKSVQRVEEEIVTSPAVEIPVAVKPQKAPTPAPAREQMKWAEPKTAGRLYGWLVHYADPQGNSIELREGRFFVTAQQLREGDLVLEQNTISTPHAMFTVSDETGVSVQDLRSERGLFVREQDNQAYRREYDTASLRHGDWVRFGDIEFLVCLISG